MAFRVTLYEGFNKPDNSTKTPVGGASYDCLAVEPCSIIAPSISFNQGNAWNPTLYNYAYIPDWKRYYWVTDWTYTAGRWYAALAVDVLSSWKSDILDLDEYVIRSASQSNGFITDNMYPATSQTREYINSTFVWPKPTLSQGAYVIGIMGKNTSTVGGVSYYVSNAAFLNTLMEHMMGNTDWIGKVDEISDDLLRCLVNPTQYITCVNWFPVAPWGSGTSQVFAGWWNTGVGLPPCDNAPVLNVNLGTVPEHPQAGRGDYLNKSPYTEITVEIPPFGRFSLNPDTFHAGHDVRAYITMDAISGMGSLQLYSDVIGEGMMSQCKIGVSLSVGQSQASALGAAGGTLLTSPAAIAQVPAVGIDRAFLGFANGIGNAIQTVHGEVNCIGQNGGTAMYQQQATLKVVHHLIVDDDRLHMGRPLCKKVNLGSLSGFTQVSHFDSNIGCYKSEHDMIKNYLEGGIFIE